MPLEINKVYCENCIDTMSRMPDNFINLTITSPPYDDLRAYNGYVFEFEKISSELFRVTKQGGVVVWIVQDQTINGSESLTSFKQALFFNNIGFSIHDTMIYSKTYLPKNGNRYEQSFEYMFVFSKGKPKVFNPIKREYSENTLHRRKNKYTFNKHRGKNNDVEKKIFTIRESVIIGNIWHYSVGNMQSSKDVLAFNHPAIFPEQLAADHIYSWSNEGDLVYDCFGGSGTVAKMAHIQKRNWILSEISQEYAELAKKRISKYLNQTMLEL